MRIRTITYFLNPHWPLDESALKKAGEFNRAARSAYEAAGFTVQTTRLATLPFPEMVATTRPEPLLELAQTLEKAAQEEGFEYVALGPALPERLDSYALIPEVLGATQAVFFSGIMGTPGEGISLPAVRACAEVIQRTSTVTPDGFANLRFTALANVPPGSPFFPAAYHQGDTPTFALATEAADLAVGAFQTASSLSQGRRSLVQAVEKNAAGLTKVGEELANQFGLPFGGIDFTLAPFPSPEISLGNAMELIGTPAVGLAGSLAAAAILADTLDQAHFQRAGFSGIMLPVLEDSVLAERAGHGILAVNDLLLYSAVCGTGLDTLPLPGNTSAEHLTAILLDLAALALRLGKPLTARLMPIPGKVSGEDTAFDFGYFANSRVMGLPAAPLQGSLAGNEVFKLKPRQR